MYNIIQLNDKDLSELQQIAKELGLEKIDTLRKEELVYRILDEQAIVEATKKTAAAKSDDNRKEPRKRSRISVKKEGDKVYTATKDKAQKLEANTPALPAPAPVFKEELNSAETNKSENIPAEETVATPAETTEEKPKAKRGRKPGSKNKSTLEKAANEEQEKAVKPIPVPIDDDMELPPLDLSNSGDF
mgnify:FL=1